MTRYLFIDGGYLREKFENCIDRYHGNDGQKVDPVIPATTSALPFMPQKTFYYDCVDDQKAENETQDEFDRRVKAQVELFASIRNVAGWHVREGRLVGARKQNRRQKRVDVLLAVEMLSHAFNKNMQTAVLIAGDDDFTPLVDELLRHGTYVEVWSDHWSRSSHLIHSADAGHSMGYQFYWHLAPESFREAHPLPVESPGKLPTGGRTVKLGVASGGQSVRIVEIGGLYHFCTVQRNEFFSRYQACELKVLEQYLLERLSNSGLLPENWQEPAQPAK